MSKKLFTLAVATLCVAAASSQSAYRSDIQMEQLGRGVVAIREANQVALSWRYLSSDAMSTQFNVYRDGKKIGSTGSRQGTFFVDKNKKAAAGAQYEVRPVVNGKEQKAQGGTYTLPADAPLGYLNIPLDRPADGVTPAGDRYTYHANDASIGDVDGDGNYEIILKWDPSNSHDNAHDGYTGNVFVDCYRLSGERLWRIDLGRNVRAGAHYTQFMVYDLDGDGRAEVVMKTSDGTVDGTGKVIGDASADYREPGVSQNEVGQPYKVPTNQGRILTGSEYLTVFSGLTGQALQTIDYYPQRGNLQDWGDNRANRSDRFLACVAYLDGIHPSVVMCRGYYTRCVLAAYDWDGKELKQHWIFDSNTPGNEGYAGQGDHNLRVGDVDGDGCDEIIYGQCAIDHNGQGLYTTGMGHGDAHHLTVFAADRNQFDVWGCHENKRDGVSFRNARTGEVYWNLPSPKDDGRCLAADVDPTNPGLEMWSWESHAIYNLKGEKVIEDASTFSTNMAVWWDGDLLRELLDKNTVSKYDWKEKQVKPLQVFEGTVSNNGTKANPCLQGDILGDWREEVMMKTEDETALRIYSTTIPTQYRFHTFLQDPVYRASITAQNVAYNQPTEVGFYFGNELKGEFRGYVVK
jgi:rhamnogalacturonan endolyase